uniref:Uncharacterized protein n=1 Tax=viral metagenome TaxID=1070528 RepID=A0A6C0BWQ4_9ZZZZ
MILIYYITLFVVKIYKINKFLFILFIITSIFIFTEYKLSSNIRFSNIEEEIGDVLSKSKTGDFLLFRSYHSYDIPEFIVFKSV